MQPGDQVGPYELLRRIGEGGMGVVWEGRDTRLGRGVALKFLHDAVVDDVESRVRFEREARAVSALTHPNICVLYDLGDHDGRPYLVMELLGGQTLKERLAEGPLDEPDLLRLGRHVASALAIAHDHGILHRDLKPANLFVTAEGATKILDFGVSKALAAEAGEATELTSAGTLLGTIKYMSPEQALGREIDGRSDLFSLGAVLYQAATTRAPFDEATLNATLNAVINTDPRPLNQLASQLSGELVEVIHRLLQKKPADRFVSAAHLADRLEHIRTARAVATTASGVSPGPAVGVVAEIAPSIAVLPFVNLSADPDNEFFTDGLAEELIISLSRLSGLRVAARSSSFQFKGQALDATEVGRKLGVASVVEGSVRRAGDRVRVTAQLVDVDTGYQKWSERFDGTLDDIFQIQEDTATAIVKGLQVQLGTSGPQAVMRRHTASREAYELYLKGRYHWGRRHKGGLQQALDAFQRAVAIDPQYALAWVGVADSYWSMVVYGMAPYAEATERAERAVARALAIDPQAAEAIGSQGAILFCRRQWADAVESFRRAIDLDPNYWFGYGYLALVRGLQLRVQETVQLAHQAVSVEPDYHYNWGICGLACHFVGDHKLAVEFASSGLNRDADSQVSFMCRGLALTELGEHERAIADLRRSVEIGNRTAFVVGCLAYGLGVAGRVDEARTLIEELERRRENEHVADVCFYLAWTPLDRERAHAALAADIEAGGPAWTAGVIGRPFPDLLERIGLPAREQ